MASGKGTRMKLQNSAEDRRELERNIKELEGAIMGGAYNTYDEKMKDIKKLRRLRRLR